MFNLGLAFMAVGLLLRWWSTWGLAVFALGILVWVGAVLHFLWQRWRGVPLPPPPRRPPPQMPELWAEPDRAVALESPEVPEGIRAAVLRHRQPGDVLWRCVRQAGRRKGLHLEWWLMTADGDLIEAFWND